jgi:hypothetical protein
MRRFNAIAKAATLAQENAIRSISIGAALILCAAPAFAQGVTAAKAATIVSTAAQVGDTLSTLRAADWSQRETNHLIQGGNTGLVLTKLAAGTINAVGSLKAAKRHPKIVFYLQMSLGAGLTYVTYRNTQNRR